MNSANFTLYALNEGSPAVAEAYAWGLQQLGHTVRLPRDEIPADEIHLFFGLPDVSHQSLMESAPRAIHVNLEQIGGRQPRFETRAGSFALMRKLPNWDFSRHNIDVLRASGVTDVSRIPIGYAPALERIAPQPRDLDVVCLQMPDARGLALIRTMQARGLKVECNLKGDWSIAQSDSLVARSKLVLLLAREEDVHVLPEPRLGYLLANRAVVVCEIKPDSHMEDDMRQCVAGALMAALADLCVGLCADAGQCHALAERGYQTFKQREWLPQLKAAVDAFLASSATRSQPQTLNVAPPRKLNIGSGKTWKHDHFNIDIDPTRGADLVFDLNHPFAYDDTYPTWRFGKIRLAKGHFEYILAEHVFEHVRELTQCVTTCMEWLVEGGVLEVEVPYDLSYGAWQDPTHIRGFNERSWLYYTDWCWYVGWREHRFDLVSNVFELSDIGRQMKSRGVEMDTILRTPRAVDVMRATFSKRALTEDEKLAHAPYFRTVS
ncbi:MAG: methyltransferase domain-containing protein [Bdellovibrionales bacterium]|nr:methyltransferase domain-containing protein [Ramlibacter sp.]